MKLKKEQIIKVSIIADQRAGRREGRHHQLSRRPPGARSAASCTDGRPADPGRHRRASTGPRTLLGERLNTLVQSTLGDVDVIGFCIPADEKIGPGDRFINEQLDAYPRAKKVASSRRSTPRARAVASSCSPCRQLRDWEAIVPISATSRIQLDTDHRADALLPSGPALPDGAVTDEGRGPHRRVHP